MRLAYFEKIELARHREAQANCRGRDVLDAEAEPFEARIGKSLDDSVKFNKKPSYVSFNCNRETSRGRLREMNLDEIRRPGRF